MGIDANIALQAKNPTFDNPVNLLGQMLQMQGLQQQNALSQFQMQQARTSSDKENAIARIVGDPSFDRKAPGAINRLYAVDPTRASKYSKDWADADKTEADIAETRAKTAGFSTDNIQKNLGVLSTLTKNVMANPSPQTAQQALAQWEQYTGKVDPNERQAVAALQTPDQAAAWARAHALKAEELKTQYQTNNTGGATTTLAINPVTNQATPINSTVNTQSPDNAATQATTKRGQNMVDARSREATAAIPRGTYDPERGLMINPRTAEATPVTQDGVSVGPRAPKLKEIPVSVNKAILENQQGLANIDRAMAAIDSHPGALGPMNMIPGSQTLRQYSDPEGVAARANIADIGSLKLHDRSGAAVSASEFPRLAPFIPSASDSPATAKKKLAQFRENFELEAQMLGQQYGEDQGYRASPLLGSARSSDGARAVSSPATSAPKVMHFDANGNLVN